MSLKEDEAGERDAFLVVCSEKKNLILPFVASHFGGGMARDNYTVSPRFLLSHDYTNARLERKKPINGVAADDRENYSRGKCVSERVYRAHFLLILREKCRGEIALKKRRRENGEN